jgi:hypothetical protein
MRARGDTPNLKSIGSIDASYRLKYANIPTHIPIPFVFCCLFIKSRQFAHSLEIRYVVARPVGILLQPPGQIARHNRTTAKYKECIQKVIITTYGYCSSTQSRPRFGSGLPTLNFL